MSSRDSPISDELTRPATLVADWESLPDSFSEWRVGQQLGPFRLKRQLGQGGMGMVWLAEQLEPLQREVALKVMLPASQSRLAEARFEVERQALAQLSHRAIARIFDAGRLPGGGLFFAMEYVPGVPLDTFVAEDQPRLTVLAELMIELCAGVHHAHQRGLIHRDIKPLNILVDRSDDKAQPKLIDFGIAISAGADAEDPGGRYYRAGTRAYMSPEQLAPDATGVDMRADVYALGAVLAQCLLIHAGLQPVGEHTFDSTDARVDLERSLGTGNENQPAGSVAARSGLGRFPAELRAIALKAMAADREQRYDSVAALADDLRRWLRREPVTALSESRWYRMRCLLRRHALASLAASLVLVALVAGLATALFGLDQARQGRAEAEQARLLAEQRRNDAEQLIQFMLGDFATRLRPLGRLDLLDEVSSEALAYLTDRTDIADPASALSRARALRTLGEVQSHRQQFESAAETLARSAGLIEPWADRREAELSEMHFEAGQIEFWRGLVAYRQRDFDTTERHWQRYRLAAEAFGETSDDPARAERERAYAHSNLGSLAEARSEWDEALEHFRKNAAILEAQVDPDDVSSVLMLANTYSWKGRVQNALGRPVAAWASANEALALVAGQRANAPEHARRRQLEINFRFILAYQAMFLDRPDLAAEQLHAAVALAEEDVANDPTQPRRQAQLARMAFYLAGLEATDFEQASAMLLRGEQAMDEAQALGLDPQQQVELPARHVLARLVVGQDSAEILDQAVVALDDLVLTLAEREEFDAHFFALSELAVGLAEQLASHGRPATPEQLTMIGDRLSAVPERQQQSIRYLMIRAQLARLHIGPGAELASLQQKIATMRDRVDLTDD